MAADNDKEKKYLEELDKLLKGEGAETEDAALKEDLDFSRKLMMLSSDPAPAFKSELQRRLLTRLVESEQARAARRWWQFRPDVRWISFAATAAVVILAIIGLLGYRSLFYRPATAPTSPTTPAQPSGFPAPTAPTTVPTTSKPTTPSAPMPPSAGVPETPQQEPSLSRPPQKSGGSVYVSWAYHFENLPDLTAFSDAVVVAVVNKVGPTVDEGRGAYSTRSTLNVETVLKGPSLTQITISQIGSPSVLDSDASDDPLFRAGERYILFLHEYAPGQYNTFGPQTRYLIWNGRVYSMNYVLSSSAYRPPIDLNFFGVSLDEMSRDIIKITNSVQLIFTQGEPKLNADVLRYPAGTTLQIDARLSSGEHGPAGVTLTIAKTGLPAGLNVSQPAPFVANPRNVYVSTITISMSPSLAPGTYYIPVDYNFGDSFIGRRIITLHVEPP